jgi:serine kinase of HPr protein (carbohydrate metabolism regulator)
VRVRDIQDRLKMDLAAGEKGVDREITGGYCGDLLSDVIANSGQGNLWLTIQAHQNIVAVAVLKELAAIILVNGRRPDQDTKAKADDEGIPMLVSPLSAYQLAGRLYELGIGRIKD